MFCIAFLRSIFDEVNTMDFVIEKIMVGSSVLHTLCSSNLLGFSIYCFNSKTKEEVQELTNWAKPRQCASTERSFLFPFLTSALKSTLSGLFCNIFYFRLSPKGLLMPIDARCLWWTPDQMNYTRICLMKETKMEPDSNSGAEWK